MSAEQDAFRETVRSFLNRANGLQTEGDGAAMSAAVLDEAIRAGRTYQHWEPDPNNPGKFREWNPQNEDGTFKYLPGLDGPVST